MTNTAQNTIEDVSDYFDDAFNDLEPVDFIDMAEELRRKLADYTTKAQSKITSNIEAMYQARHEDSVRTDYRRGLL